MPPRLDKHERIIRAHAAELAREARIEADRRANAARIREQIEDGTAGIGGSRNSFPKQTNNEEDF